LGDSAGANLTAGDNCSVLRFKAFQHLKVRWRPQDRRTPLSLRPFYGTVASAWVPTLPSCRQLYYSFPLD